MHRIVKLLVKNYCLSRCFSFTSSNNVKVTVCGASGGIGQPLSLLLKQCPLVSELSMYDIVHTSGVAKDLSHVNTAVRTKGFVGAENLPEALLGAEIVMVAAGVPRKPGMKRKDLFLKNAEIVRNIIEACVKYCPEALIGIISNPVNSTVPFASEIMKKKSVYDPRRIFGVTTLDLIRASTFVAETKGLDPQNVEVEVIGGHSGATIIPLLSRIKPAVQLADHEVLVLTTRIQQAGTEIVKAKAGLGSATLSMAYAGAKFTISLCKAILGEENVTECSFVASDVMNTGYLASPLLLGKEGIKKNLGIGKLSKYEHDLLDNAIPELMKQIEKGIEFANKN